MHRPNTARQKNCQFCLDVTKNLSQTWSHKIGIMDMLDNHLPINAQTSSLAEHQFNIGQFSYFMAMDYADRWDRSYYTHFVVNERTGDTLDIAFTSAVPMTKFDLARWIDMGCPEFDLSGIFPVSWTPKSLETAWIASQHTGPTYPEQFLIGTPPNPAAKKPLWKIMVLFFVAGLTFALTN